jgi:hypothetical protein
MEVAVKVMDCTDDDACGFERVYNEVSLLQHSQHFSKLSNSRHCLEPQGVDNAARHVGKMTCSATALTPVALCLVAMSRLSLQVVSLEALRGQPSVVPLLEYGVTCSLNGSRQWVLVFPRYASSMREWRLKKGSRGLAPQDLPVYLRLFMQVCVHSPTSAPDCGCFGMSTAGDGSSRSRWNHGPYSLL